MRSLAVRHWQVQARDLQVGIHAKCHALLRAGVARAIDGLVAQGVATIDQAASVEQRAGCILPARAIPAPADVIDAALVEDGTIAPHPPLAGSSSSGYRLLERAYAEIIQKLPAEIVPIVPVWDQVHWESFHSQYVAGIDMETWQGLLNLRPVGSEQ